MAALQQVNIHLCAASPGIMANNPPLLQVCSSLIMQRFAFLCARAQTKAKRDQELHKSQKECLRSEAEVNRICRSRARRVFQSVLGVSYNGEKWLSRCTLPCLLASRPRRWLPCGMAENKCLLHCTVALTCTRYIVVVHGLFHIQLCRPFFFFLVFSDIG